MASCSWEVQTLSLYQKPHHLTSEHALSLLYIKGGHRWSSASPALGVASTKCCCSSGVRNVPYGVNVWSCNCSCVSQCHWAQPCMSVPVLLFSLNSLRNYCRKPSLAMCCFLPLCCGHVTGAECYCSYSVFIVTECCALILQHTVVMKRCPCSPE